MATKTEEFEIHPGVIRQLIENQAGTTSKAILEGVMNGVDAMYDVDCRLAITNPRIDIDFNFDRVVISDNGRGLRTEDEIKEVFKTFGQPHVAGDARFGRFRIGRGQLFGQGKTTYTSNEFRLYVDYRGDGDKISYEFNDDGDYGGGTTVRVDFYDDQLPRHEDFHHTCNTIADAVRYLDDVEIYLNGDLISDGINSETWTIEDEHAYYKLSKKSGYGQVKIYNQGIYVESASSYDWGVSGVVVSKAALPVNQARNQVQRNNSAWKTIKETCKAYGGKQIRTKVVLDDHEVESTLRELEAHPEPKCGCDHYQELLQAHYKAWEDIARLRIWRDVTDSLCSMNSFNLQAGKKGTIVRTDDNRVPVVFAPVGDTKGEGLHRSKRAFVLDESLLTRFKVSGEEFLSQVFKSIANVTSKFVVVTAEAILQGEDSSFSTLKPEQLKPRERWILNALNELNWRLSAAVSSTADGRSRYDPRTLLVGVGPADSWTNGETYIALERDYLAQFNQITPGVFEKIISHVTWQYCWASDNKESRRATAEQRELYIELMMDKVAGFGWKTWKNYVNILDRDGKKLPADQLRRVRQMESMGEIEYAYVMWKDDDAAAFQRLEETQTTETD